LTPAAYLGGVVVDRPFLKMKNVIEREKLTIRGRE